MLDLNLTVSLVLAISAFGLYASQAVKPYAPVVEALKPKRKRTKRAPGSNDELLAEINSEVHKEKIEMVRGALNDWPDTSADAIADYFDVPRATARALCKGVKRANAKAHKGNDYECR